MENNRLIINDCEPQDFNNFISALKKNRALQLKNYKPATDSAIQERYAFECDYENISVVYETKARVCIITAADYLRSLLKNDFDRARTQKLIQPPRMTDAEEPDKMIPDAMIPAGLVSPAQSNPQQNQRPGLKPKKKEKQTKTHGQKLPVKARTESQANEPKSQELNPKEIRAQEVRQQRETKPQEKQAKGVNPQQKIRLQQEFKPQDTKLPEDLYKNGYTVKNISPEKLEEIIKQVKSQKGVSASRQEANGVCVYTVTDAKNKIYLRHFVSKRQLVMQGKRSPLFGAVQTVLIKDSDYMEAVSSHIQLTGEEKKAKDMEKKLKKLLPSAFEFLSEQSRIDFTIGMIDIANDDVRLSDYSMLLVPPYRGLERLIFELQRAEGIAVKMIGQGFEKEDGRYILKAGYQKRIGSIVYAEVMAALYTEYFEKRNFYAHSDITGDLLSRVITDKETVKSIFSRLIGLIEYNIKKLKEIGFKL